MERLVVTAVRFVDEKLVALKMGKAEDSAPTWTSAPQEVALIDVVDELAAGNVVATVFPKDGLTVSGPNLRRITDSTGWESVAMEGEPINGLTISDLPTF